MRAWWLLVLIGCGRINFERSFEAERVDAPAPVARCTTWSPWSAPVREAAFNTPDSEYGAALTADDLVLCVSSRVGGGSRDLWCSTRADRASPFPAPTVLAGVNSPSEESDVVLAADGLEVLFASNRPGGVGDKDIYVATRASRGDDFAAVTLVASLATAGAEEPEAISADGLRLYFTQVVPPEGTQLFVATRTARGAPFESPQALATLNSAGADEGLATSADELEVIFASSRTGGIGMHDIYRATRTTRAEPFGAPVLVPELCTPNDDLPGALTSDGATLYLNFDMDLSGSIPSDLWSTTRTCLD